jgi:membrane protease subunit HflC
MAMERKQFAEAKRAQGMEKSEEIKALADQRVTVIRAEAIKKAATLRAQGDKEAAEIYAKAYGLNPQFYSFYRSLEAYKSSFNQKNDILLLKPDSQFFNYFHGMQSQKR